MPCKPKLLRSWYERFADDSGASLIEYALVLALVSVGAFVALTIIGSNANATLTSAAGALGS